MSPLKKGPEIKLPTKLPKVRAPKLVVDVYQDLRTRHLLPLVALLIVAIVAAPILLHESGGSEPSEAAESGATAAASTAAGQSSGRVLVAKEAPQLRDYKIRLGNRTAQNPFRQQYVHSPGEGNNTEGSEEGGSTGSGEAPTQSTETTIEHTETHEVTYFTYKIDVRITPVSSDGSGSSKPTVRHNVAELTPLPGHKTPALTYLQPSSDRKQALMLVGENVVGVFGESVCVQGGEHCQLLALKEGQPETVVYGANERTFKIELIRVNVVVVDAHEGSSKQAEGKPHKHPEEGGAQAGAFRFTSTTTQPR
ncbi:MAG TPA: hypothetical protein VMT37_13505 [Solirubrobacterales bacterium]|nr:hypothetical protein [Solirubrobacterales bacterium]